MKKRKGKAPGDKQHAIHNRRKSFARGEAEKLKTRGERGSTPTGKKDLMCVKTLKGKTLSYSSRRGDGFLCTALIGQCDNVGRMAMMSQ